ncbi:MAG TPA: FMN-binding protein [Candidatus Limnocylindria bacterium]|jgi:Na+-translocating ferredoxin:NAD+ oxidoreductase RnfG subunit|nr:FMN-binding protein [Candidatus Limnocylindria bacterium]
MSGRIHYLAVPAIVVGAFHGYAAVYHTVESAQKACFPEAATFVSADVKLSSQEMKAIEKASGVRVRLENQKIWKVEKNGQALGWFIVDEVLGKHEFITWALALKSDGSVQSLEIMEYRETYGYEVRNADWRAQFVGKKNGARLKLDDDIKNVSGATLSCRHITDGVKRLLALYDLVLKH